MSLKSLHSKLFKRNAGVYGGLPRFTRVGDSAGIYGYLASAESVTNPFLIENIRLGAASADVVVNDGDLIFDNSTGRYFYALGLQPRYLSGMIVGYDFKAYVCNNVFSVQRLFEGPRDVFTQEPSPSTYQNVITGVRGMVFNERFWVEQRSFSEEDVSQYVIYHNFLGVKAGDLFVSSNGTKYLSKIVDLNIFNGLMVRSLCQKGAGG